MQYMAANDPILPGPDLVFKVTSLFRGCRARAGHDSNTPLLRLRTDTGRVWN
jgi:hypothetical protein